MDVLHHMPGRFYSAGIRREDILSGITQTINSKMHILDQLQYFYCILLLNADISFKKF